jgi:hypothetical protein
LADDPVERPVDHLLAPLVELAQELAEPVKPVGDLRVVLVVACRGDEVGERHLLGWERRTDPALESTFGPDPAAELPLRRKRGDGRVTGEEIRSLVEQLKGIVGVLQNAHPGRRLDPIPHRRPPPCEGRAERVY